jgi:hypothetical protein
MKKRHPLQQMFLGKLDICLQITEIRFMFTPWIKGLNTRPETLKPAGKSREYTGGNRHRQGLSQ